MAALYFTQGTCVRPWRPDLCYGAVRDGEALRVAVASPREWSGRLVFNTARHRRHIGLPVNYPRLNELPEWFTVEPERTYRVKVEGEWARTVRGADLADGLQLHATAGRPITVRIEANP